MISETAQTIITAIIALKVAVSAFFFVAPPENPPFFEISIENKELVASNNSPDDDSSFEEFLDFIKERGVSFVTLLEAGALYFLWSVVKDTKSREDLLEKVFSNWRQEEAQVRSYGKLLRSLGVSSIALHGASVQEIITHLAQGHKVILVLQEEKNLLFLPLKSVSEDTKTFNLEVSFLREGKLEEHLSINSSHYDILVFFEEPFINGPQESQADE